MTTLTATVTAIRPLTERIAEFTLEGAGLPAWEPGAHIRVHLPDGGTRAYSLIRTGALAERMRYVIAVQREDAGKGGSKFMHGLAEGSTITFDAPKCDFPVDTAAPAVLLAGGIGVTPLISMATALEEAGQDFAFHYAGRSAGLMALREVLAERFGDRLKLHFDDDPGSALDLDAVIVGLGEAHLYICGPKGMIDAARAKAEAAGVPAARVHVELFDSPAPVQGETAFEVELSSSGQVFTVAPGQSIIDALEAGGVDVLYDCRRGDCGICQCGVIEGVPDHRDVVLSADEKAAGKVMQICVSRAKTPRLVLDL